MRDCIHGALSLRRFAADAQETLAGGVALERRMRAARSVCRANACPLETERSATWHCRVAVSVHVPRRRSDGRGRRGKTDGMRGEAPAPAVGGFPKAKPGRDDGKAKRRENKNARKSGRCPGLRAPAQPWASAQGSRRRSRFGVYAFRGVFVAVSSAATRSRVVLVRSLSRAVGREALAQTRVWIDHRRIRKQSSSAPTLWTSCATSAVADVAATTRTAAGAASLG